MPTLLAYAKTFNVSVGTMQKLGQPNTTVQLRVDVPLQLTLDRVPVPADFVTLVVAAFHCTNELSQRPAVSALHVAAVSGSNPCLEPDVPLKAEKAGSAYGA